MSRRPAQRAFAARPSDADTWCHTRQALSSRESEASLFAARLTIDVTPEQRPHQGHRVPAPTARGWHVARSACREFQDKDRDPQ